MCPAHLLLYFTPAKNPILTPQNWHIQPNVDSIATDTMKSSELYQCFHIKKVILLSVSTLKPIQSPPEHCSPTPMAHLLSSAVLSKTVDGSLLVDKQIK